MKKSIKALLILLFSAAMLIFTVSCDERSDISGLWDNAAYISDTAVGEGSKSITVEIKAEGKTVTLTVKTDKATLGEALFELGIVNDPVFFDTCNGIKADYQKDSAYWAFKIDGKLQNSGIGGAEISGGESFTLEYTQGGYWGF